MILNNFIVRVILYVILIVLTSLALAWSVQQEFMVATSTGLIAALLIETISLIYFLTGIKKDLQRFVDAVKNEDSTLLFGHKNRDRFLREIHEGFNEIMRDFKLVRKEKELERQFFQNTVEHVNIGLLAINEKEEIKLINKALKDMFHLETLNNFQKLASVHKDLPDLLLTMKDKDENAIKLLLNNEMSTVSIKATTIKMENQVVRIFSFQDISRQINRSEVEAWQKLIQVLRHEIMNSISPIRIMSGNLLNIVRHLNQSFSKSNQSANEEFSRLSEGLSTIRKRSSGLSDFIEKYRSLTKIPEPSFSHINVPGLFQHVTNLMKEQLNKNNIESEVKTTPKQLTITGDEKMLEQVLLNLIKNAMEAVRANDHGKIILEAKENNEETTISIRDNGPGIPADQLDKIFIPFYTTKEDGSGIGLSFSRQIMHLHGGSIKIQSEKNTGTEVVLSF
jgi:nitrogen fixation/metabolism regulation signal transduction histidine kinase